MEPRIRLRFDDSCAPGDGLCQWWFALAPGMRSIGDVEEGIHSTFQLARTCPHGIILFMEEYALPSMQPVSLLKDRDIVSVKPLNHTNATALVAQNRDLRAPHEFENESGGYKSEDEGRSDEDQSTEGTITTHALTIKSQQPKLAEATSNPAKRKSGDNKRKRSETTPKRPLALEDAGTVKSREAKRRRKAEPEPQPPPPPEESVSESSESESEEPESSESESEPEVVEKSGRTDTNKASGSADGPKQNEPKLNATPRSGENGDVKKVSRSARRKKAKRAWLRREAQGGLKANEDRVQDAQIDESALPSEERHAQLHEDPKQPLSTQNVLPDADGSKKVNVVMVRPGHFKFAYSDEENEVNGENATGPNVNFNTEFRSKRQGQSWGQQKRGRQSQKSFNEASNVPDETIQVDAMVVDPVVPAPTVDFEGLTSLQRPPKEGDVLAYKMVELSSTMTPELSSFRVGEVERFDDTTNSLKLKPVSEFPFERSEHGNYDDDGSLETEFSMLLDVRILRGSAGAPEVHLENGPQVQMVANGDHKQVPVDRGSTGVSKKGEKSERWRLKSSALGPALALLRAQEQL